MTGVPDPRTEITGTRNHEAAIRRETIADRINATARRAGVRLLGWQIRSLLGSLTANHDTPTDEDIFRALMAAPWSPKPRLRRFRIGETGWRTTGR